jgi:hypothetical protein
VKKGFEMTVVLAVVVGDVLFTAFAALAYYGVGRI